MWKMREDKANAWIIKQANNLFPLSVKDTALGLGLGGNKLLPQTSRAFFLKTHVISAAATAEGAEEEEDRTQHQPSLANTT